MVQKLQAIAEIAIHVVCFTKFLSWKCLLRSCTRVYVLKKMKKKKRFSYLPTLFFFGHVTLNTVFFFWPNKTHTLTQIDKVWRSRSLPDCDPSDNDLVYGYIYRIHNINMYQSLGCNSKILNRTLT